MSPDYSMYIFTLYQLMHTTATLLIVQNQTIPCVFSHSADSCKYRWCNTHALTICSSTISHINICTSISISFHIKNEVLCIHRTSSDTQIVSSPCHCHNSCILLTKHIIYNFIQMHTIRAFDQHDIFRLHHRKQIQSNLAIVLEAVTVDI